jgi:hypothetical protein
MPFLQISGFLRLEMQNGIVVIPVTTVINRCFQAFRAVLVQKKRTTNLGLPMATTY